MRVRLSALLVVAVALTAWPTFAQVNQQAIADVAAGKLKAATSAMAC